MLYLSIVMSIIFWAAAAVALSPKHRGLNLMERMGRWFFAVSLVITPAMWLAVPVVQADRALDPSVTVLIPRWYDGTLETWIPNAMLAVSATAAWGATGAGLFFRFKLYTLLGFNWYYLAEVLPWVLSAKAPSDSGQWQPRFAYRLTTGDVWPLVFVNGISVALFVCLYAFISYMERYLRSYALPSAGAESAF